jgi:bifunctional non-homologous end joining protein LigD
MAATESLDRYHQKRDFGRTAEPRGLAKAKAKRPADAELSFVVHEHAARTHHFDFRLELDGVLLSWAVPKGPSLDPKDKRLAVETEPHPLEYGKFEGTIAEGQYGAGKVHIWDRGTWHPEGDAHDGYERGKLSFRLEGEKLRGTWHLVRTNKGSKKTKQWLLFKSREGRDDSAPRGKAPSVPIAPELATLVTSAPEGDDWVHELKFDGYRVMVQCQGAGVRLFTRNANDWTDKFSALARVFEKLPVDSALFDGEVVALDERGVSDFQTLQNSLTLGRDGALLYYAFDLLELDGVDQRALPLVTRKQALTQLLEKLPKAAASMVRSSRHVTGRGPVFFRKACERGAEGIVSKRALSPYRAGRGSDWVKVKCTKRQEFVIVGYTEPGGSRSHFGALLLAVVENDGLVYAGRVGTGFTEQSLAEIHQRLEPLSAERPDLKNAPKGADARGVHWVRPELVAEVGFTSRTQDGLLRHPAFFGLRDDKPASEVKTEVPVETPAASAPSVSKRAASYPLTNPDKVLYPEDGITKRELLEYYELVAERMLPHVRNRPLTVVRCPNGIGKACFFQKHPGEGTPESIRLVSIREKDGEAPYAVVDDEQGLFALIQLASLEIHTSGARADDPEHPDIIVFDLDPDPALDFSLVIDCARELKQVFDGAGLDSFVKTTGGKGLHVCVPTQPELDWDAIKGFAQRVADRLVRGGASRYVATASKSKRTGKIYIDYLRNARGATFIAPYSARAREHAPIAMPLEWDELTPKFRPEVLTLRAVRERLVGGAPDPFARLTTLSPSLTAELERTRPHARK